MTVSKLKSKGKNRLCIPCWCSFVLVTIFLFMMIKQEYIQRDLDLSHQPIETDQDLRPLQIETGQDLRPQPVETGHDPSSQPIETRHDPSSQPIETDIQSSQPLEKCPEKNNLDSFNQFQPTDHQVVKYFKCHHLTPPSKLSYNLTSSKDPSMHVKEIAKLFGKKQTPGFFIEVGANDGEVASNTLILEMRHKWTGLLIEGSPKLVDQLKQKHRSAWVADVCLSTETIPREMEFLTTQFENNTQVGKLRVPIPPGLKDPDVTDPKLWESKPRRVPCFPLLTMLTALNVTHVDFFSLDVQGAELKILKTLPWDDSLVIEVINAEYVYDPEGPPALRKFMESKGYDMVLESYPDFFFIRRGSSYSL